MVIHIDDKFRTVTDNWHGNYKGNTVEVSLWQNVRKSKYKWDKPLYAVSIWGNDDFGVRKEFPYNSPTEEAQAKKEAEELYNKVLSCTDFNKEMAYGLGFKMD